MEEKLDKYEDGKLSRVSPVISFPEKVEKTKDRMRLGREAVRTIARFSWEDWRTFYWLSRVPLPLVHIHRMFYHPQKDVLYVKNRLDRLCHKMILEKMAMHYLGAFRGPRGLCKLVEGNRGGLYDFYFIGYFGEKVLRELGIPFVYSVYRDIYGHRRDSVAMTERLIHQAETTRILVRALEESRGEDPPYTLSSWWPEEMAKRVYRAPFPTPMGTVENKKKLFSPDAMMELIPSFDPGRVLRLYLEYTTENFRGLERTGKIVRKLRNYYYYRRYGAWKISIQKFPTILFFCESATGVSRLGDLIAKSFFLLRREESSFGPISAYLSCFEWMERVESLSVSPWLVMSSKRAKALEVVPFSFLLERESVSGVPVGFRVVTATKEGEGIWAKGGGKRIPVEIPKAQMRSDLRELESGKGRVMEGTLLPEEPDYEVINSLFLDIAEDMSF